MSISRSVALAIAVASLGLGGAGPQRAATPLVIPQYGDDFPISPIPPASTFGYEAAPVPNGSLSAPQQPTTTGPKIQPRFFNQRSFNGGQGYVPGSTIESQQEQRQQPVPGLNLNVPLQ